MKLGLDNIEFTCYTWKEIESMITMNEGVKRLVLNEIRKSVQPGCAVTKRAWKVAYEVVRARAIAETEMWKAKYITIERG